MKVISYSLFSWNKTYQNSFDFNTYLRGLAINVRMARLLYPDWVIRLQTDQETFDRWGALFMAYGIETQINEPAPLCKAMLWRLKPVFDPTVSYVICRDLDSPLTLRERKCVQEWINEGKIGHAITDSISHTIPMMGGMIGFYRPYFKDATGISTFEQLFEGCNLDFNIKGTDQTLLNQLIYPKLAQHGTDSITQHYILGMPNTFLSGYHNTVPDIDCGDYEGSNDSCGHIGAAGFYEAPAFKFFRQYKDKFKDIIEAERAYPLIFNWNE